MYGPDWWLKIRREPDGYEFTLSLRLDARVHSPDGKTDRKVTKVRVWSRMGGGLLLVWTILVSVITRVNTMTMSDKRGVG